MADIFGAVFWLAISLGILVTIHEFGHYWVARRCGVTVLRFSYGFGKVLWSRRDRHGTDWAVSALPLGGYVKMLDRREGVVSDAELAGEYNAKPAWQRALIILAGPIANLLLCIALIWLLLVIGKPDFAPIIGKTEGLAAEAGLREGDRIIAVGERPVQTWTDAAIALSGPALDRRDVPLSVTNEGQTRQLNLALSKPDLGFQERDVFGSLGITFTQMLSPAVVGHVVAGGPADGQIQAGDRITALNGQPVRFHQDIAPIVGASAGRPMAVELLRDGQALGMELTPRQYIVDGAPVWRLGIAGQASPVSPDAVARMGLVAALPEAVQRTWTMTLDTLGMLGRLVIGRASTENLSGIITIARASNETAKRGLPYYLNLLAMLSLSLFIINLLPVPVLDGGHLLNLGIEKLRGRPLSDDFLYKTQTVGLLLLVGLMGLTFYNDVFRPPF